MKNQVGLEFLTYSIIFIIAMGIMLSIVAILGIDLIELQKSNALKKVAERISTSLVLVKSQEQGFVYTIKLDKTIAGYPFRVRLLDRSVEVSLLEENNLASRELYVYSIKIPLTSYCSSITLEFLSPLELNFENKNGCIEVTT